jgi:hypothetical protein
MEIAESQWPSWFDFPYEQLRLMAEWRLLDKYNLDEACLALRCVISHLKASSG